MKLFDSALAKMREICLSLPDTKETPTWGEPHFRVGEKIFAGLGDKKGVVTIGFKLEMDHADAMIRRPGFSRAPYVGHKGWVSLDVAAVRDWDEVRALVRQSYRLIAPRRTVETWLNEPPPKAPRPAVRKAAPNRPRKAPRPPGRRPRRARKAG